MGSDPINTLEFPTLYSEILNRIASIDPIKYGISRNYIDGAVSYLSPYISRGVVSTQFIMKSLIKKGYSLHTIEKFIQELAWRDYWQRVWQVKQTEINTDLRQKQKPVRSQKISSAILNASTGIHAIDDAIHSFYSTGYLHNHIRMYIAAISCNMGHNHWKHPAQWMYYYLLDADWGSNALSWQWVAGTNSNKKYYANQENINTYCQTNQKGTFLDIDYDAFQFFEAPKELLPTEIFHLTTKLPEPDELVLSEQLPNFIYNAYNLDPLWQKDIEANRILLLEPSHFDAYPMAKKSIDFIISLSKNIVGIQIYVGEFKDLQMKLNLGTIHYKEHPLNKHYKGIQTPREWMTSTEDYFSSFFKFWKQSKKEILEFFPQE